MVDLSRIFSAEWAAAAQLGEVYAQAKQLTKLPARQPRLLVPVDLQALVVPSGGKTGTGRGDIRSRMLDKSPDERLPPPFTAAEDLPAGVHLHWAMPDGLTKGRPAEPGSSERDLRLRPLPDRWLVVRLSPTSLGKARPTKSWIVLSDRGQSMPLVDWDPGKPAEPGSALGFGQFTAAAGGDLGWAGIYDNVTDRLAFYDDLADLTGPATLCYVVVGWYADPSLDPLHPPTDPSGFTALLDDLGWDADLSALPEIETNFASADLHLEQLATQVGIEVPDVIRGGGIFADPGSFGVIERPTLDRLPGERVPIDRPALRPIARLAQPETLRAGQVSFTPLSDDKLQLNPKVAVTMVPRQPRVTSSLYHGTIYGVVTQGTGTDERPAAGQVSLTLGSTGIDVVSKMLAGADAAQERLLNAFAYGALRDYSTDDGIIAHDEAVHRHGFAALPDPKPGTPEKVRDPILVTPTPPGLGKHVADQVVDIAEQAGVKMKIAFASTWEAAQQITLSEVEEIKGLTFAGSPFAPGPNPQPRPPAAATFTSIVRPNPRWYAPTEPVLGVRGAHRSLRHGYDGRFDPGERLACRLSTQPIRGYADLLQGRVVVNPLGHGGLPVECDELVREASLGDPNALEHLVSLVPAELGWTKAQVTNRLQAEMVLTTHLNAREGDVGELLDVSIREGVESSPVGVTYWRQPWVPVYAEWEAQLATTDQISAWALGEIDLDPARTPDPLAGHTLLGRSLLNSSSARTLAASVDQFLEAESDADLNGTGIISEADARDLATLALSAARSDLLVGSLDGLNDHFLGFDTDVAFADATAAAPITSPNRLPDMVRGGWLRLDRLRLVDAYGRVLDLTGRLPTLGLADALVTEGTPAALSTPTAARPAHLPPRFSLLSRLQLRFIDAGTAADAVVDESTPVHVGNPVAGWLLPDHADDALEFFDAAGTPLGQLFHRGPRSAVTWEGAPGRPGPMGAGPAGDLAGSEHLARMAVALVQRDAGERAAGAVQDESPLGALLRAIDTTLWTADPVGSSGTAPVSVLVGRPIAAVRLRLQLEVYDDSADYALSPAEVTERRAAITGAARYPVTVRLGALGRFDDGVLGYFLDDDYSIFHPVHSAILELARLGGPQHGFLDEVSAAAAYAETLTPEQIRAPYLQGEPDLIVHAGRPVTLTVLTLAGLSINATSGVVPRKRLELNRSWTDEALQKIVPSFRVGPVLVDPAAIAMPRISALPTDRGDQATTTWTRRDTPATWREDPILASSMAAKLVDHPPVAHEGWVRLVITEPS